MSETLAHYGFIPWLRQGVASKINESDTLGVGSGTVNERAKIDVDVILQDTEIGGGSNEHTISKKISIYGPGDIIGISNRAIVKTEPRNHVKNFEPNLLPYIEFYEEDFPWRYTPAKTGTGANATKLRPWIALIVLQEDEYSLVPTSDGLARIKIHQEKLNTALYNHKEIWAWAHVHMNKDFDHSGGEDLIQEVSQDLDNDPDNGISRILCPRKLQKSTAYTAFLIPAFETGRLAGLGEDTLEVKAQEPSWRMTGENISTNALHQNTFPVYYHWEFSTGALGDFESLVSVLKPIITTADSGTLAMDIQDPGYNMQDVATQPNVKVEGALKPPAFESQIGDAAAGGQEFVEKLKTIINLSIDLNKDSAAVNTTNPFYNANVQDDPIIVPPIYGFWHSLAQSVGNQNPTWLDQLNLDPRYRGIAGLGTTVIQKHQDKLMHRAWTQVGDIKEANQKIKEAQMAKLVSLSIFKKHLKNTEGDRFAEITASTQNFVVNVSDSKTVSKVLKDSRIPIAARSAAFRRIVRPRKKSNRSLNKLSTAALHQNILSKFNLADDAGLTAAKLKTSPQNAMDFEKISNSITSLENDYKNNKFYMAKDAIFQVIETLNLDNINDLSLLLNAFDVNISTEAKTLATKGINDLDKSSYTKDENNISVKMASATFKEIFGQDGSVENIPTRKILRNVTLFRDPDLGENDWGSKSTNLEDIQNYGTSFGGLMEKTTQSVFQKSEPLALQKAPIGNIDNVFINLKSKLDPKFTLTRKLRNRISLFRANDKPVKPIMAHPKFDDPMYEEIKKISQDFILPNVEKLPVNSITLMESNQKFIESFMVGLNHEMSRELLWRAFPSDQRGSYFRQFWETEDNIFEEEPENNYSVQELHKWKGKLGEHPVHNNADGFLVLVVRGELLHKYPNTMIYAQKAIYNEADPTLERKLPESMSEVNTKFPVFKAQLEPDIFLYGFALTEAEARGERVSNALVNTSSMNPGWFFVFKERPGEIKFGFDDFVDDLGNAIMPNGNPENWNNLSWEHLVNQREDLKNYMINFKKTINITVPIPDRVNPKWGNNSADLAHILYQNPVLFARHAEEMLPEA